MRGALAGLLAAVALAGAAAAADRMEFWNLTSNTITRLRMAHAGTTEFGPDQCANDKDGTVDHDERLRLAGVKPGQYDVQVTDAKGRQCLARDITVVGSKRVAFSLSDKDLKDCSGP